MRGQLRFILAGIVALFIAAGIPDVKDILTTMYYNKEIRYQFSIYSDNAVQYINAIVSEPVKTISTSTGIVTIDTDENISLTHGQSLSAEQIDTILKDIGSPAVGIGKHAVEVGIKNNIDAAYWLAMFIEESSAATNINWAGMKDGNNTTHNTGNIICTPNDGHKCFGRFIDFDNWEEGTTAHIELLAYYRDRLGHKDIYTALYTWSPRGDGANDPDSYGGHVTTLVNKWRSVNSQPVVVLNTSNTTIHQVTKDLIVNANFYYINCDFWSSQPGCQHLGTDYALEDMEPVYAPVNGVYLLTDAYPENDAFRRKGAYVMYKTYDGYELYFGHMQKPVQMNAGDIINAGDVLGYGRADLAHTHVQLRTPDGQLSDFEGYYNERLHK